MSVTHANPTVARRQAHLGHWLAQAQQRFDARVLVLMARNERLPLALANLCARGRLTASHGYITRHLPLQGARLTELARLAGVSKQAIGKLVTECEAWALVRRDADARDGRARRVCFTDQGRLWLQAYEDAIRQAEAELRDAVGAEVAAVIALGLEAYAA